MAMSRYSWKKQHPTSRAPKVPRVESHLKDFDNRYILDTIWDDVAPGGQEELQGLTRYVRNP
eukprot:3336298-Prorocentrum_lima.AAC.1